MGRRKRMLEELDADIRDHIERETQDNIERGMPPEEARYAATRKFGNVTRIKEETWEVWSFVWLEHLWQDIRFGLRVFAKDPRFSVLAVLGLGLGLGTSTAIFALINATMGNRAAVQDRAAYVGLYGSINGRAGYELSYAAYRYYQARATSFRFMNAESGRFGFVLGAPQASGALAGPEDISGRFESEDFLSVLGVQPALGRSFSTEEALGGSGVAVLDFRFWKNHFGGDEGILAKTIVLNAHPLTIIGIANANFGTVDTSDIYLPLGLEPALFPGRDMVHDPASLWLHLDARLQLDVTVRQAQAELDVLSRVLLQSKPITQQMEREGVFLSPGGDNPQKHKELVALAVAVMTAVSMILLIACTNLANILLARTVTRRREIGVRVSLGATRTRVISLLMTESLVLALAGGAMGLVFSHWLAGILVGMLGAPPGFTLEIDPREFVYAFALAIASAVSFGLRPALAATKVNLSQVLHSDGLTGTPRSKSHNIWAPRNMLVVIPLAISHMLLMGAGATLRAMQQHYLGGPFFDTSRLTGMRLELGLQGYGEARTRQFQESLRERIATMPAVTSVALASNMPLANGMASLPLVTEGSAAPSADLSPRTDYNVISPNFFSTVGISIRRGRNFTNEDREGTPPVAIVNQSLVGSYWNNQDPIGKRIRFGNGTCPYFEVVGVAPDFEDPSGPFNTVRPTVYVPYGQEATLLAGIQTGTPPYQMQFLVRTIGDPSGLKIALRQEVLARDPSLIIHIQTIQEMRDAMFGPIREVSVLLSALGGLALVMASVGIYAIMSFNVSQQTKEIGIRVALGAGRRDILVMVMQRTVKLIACGLAVGLAGALAVNRISSSVLSHLGSLDATTCASVSCLLAFVAVFASYIPARKGLRVDPVSAMRCE